MTIRTELSGPHAFYKADDYIEKTTHELQTRECLPTITYEHNCTHKFLRVANRITSIIIFPLILHHLIHIAAAKFIVPSSLRFNQATSHRLRSGVALDGDWKYKRITILSDGNKIDAMIMGRRKMFRNGRWYIYVPGNQELYENVMVNRDFKILLTKLKANALIYNYPGSGCSTGCTSRSALTKSYRAVLSFVETQIGAHKILGHGFSLGGAIQSEALLSHTMKPNVDYLFITDRTFSRLSIIAASFVPRPLKAIVSLAVKLERWNLNAVDHCFRIQVPHIVLQTARTEPYQQVSRVEELMNDGVIDAPSSLVNALLTDSRSLEQTHTVIIGIEEQHNDAYRDLDHLVALFRQHNKAS
jgi:hypothetical protein